MAPPASRDSDQWSSLRIGQPQSSHTPRLTWTGQELMAAGASSHYTHETCQTSCVFTLTLRNGHLKVHAVPTNKAKSWTCLGNYTVSASTVSIAFIRPCRGRVVAKMSPRNGALRLRVSLATDPGDEVFWGGKPWKKVG
jgi:hypothetical protein